MVVFERFAEDARQTVLLAGEYARELGHERVRTEHLLLGVLADPHSLTSGTLAALGITPDRVRSEMPGLEDHGTDASHSLTRFSQRAQRVLALAVTEALSLGRDQVRAEHILLALARRRDCVAARILTELGAPCARIRSEMLSRLDGPLHRAPPPLKGRIDWEAADALKLEELWARYRETGDECARQRLVVMYAPLVKHVAGRMLSGLPAHVEEADLISYGLSGLIAAVERFDPSRQTGFQLYAITRIRGSIIDGIRTLEWVPRSVRALAREIERVRDELQNRLGRAPTDEEIAGELGVSTEAFREQQRQVAHSRIVELDVLWDIYDASGDSAPVSDLLPDPDDREAPPTIGGLRDKIAGALAALPEREKMVIALLYYEELTLREISEVLDLTEDEVSQLHSQAVQRLRATLGSSDR
jgi:RNA polymerase sigma factor for flagellar operon FliA